MKNISNSDKIQELINSGSEIIGAATGGVLGFFAAGPLGAAAGGAGGTIIAKSLSNIGKEIKERLLGTREEIRIGATVSFSILKIQENLKSGKNVRTDGFFEQKVNSRSDADEILEGTLLAAQKEYEEKKLKYYGNLLGNISFDANIDKPFANQILRLAEYLSYNQLCILMVIYQSGNLKKLMLRNKNYRSNNSIDRKLITILYDLIDLEKMNLIVNSEHHVFGITDIIPSEFSCQGNGNALIHLMELMSIPNEDCNEIIKLLNE